MLLSAATILLSSFLLFQIQPMIAKMILPWFGGSAAVWVTAMLFFQSALLAGYLYAHWSVRRLGPKAQAVLHGALLLLSLLALPAAPAAAWKPSGREDPILRILALLTMSVGLPYFVLSTTSPLIQAWHSRRHGAALPYKLFGLSNLASLAGLLAYPFFIEPNLTLRQQSVAWTVSYVLFAVLAAWSAVSSSSVAPGARSRTDGGGPSAACPAPGAREQALWLALAACSSTLLLAVTNHLTQNVASVPFLWILPLGLYLLTFSLAFDFERLYHRAVFTWLTIAALPAMAHGLLRWNSHTSLKLVIPAFSAGLFIVCMYCHGELVKRKPHPRHLTSFYLMLSLGGALGGVLVGLLAPKLLPGNFELTFALAGAAVLLPVVMEYRGRRFFAAAGWAAAVAVIVAGGLYVSSYLESSRVMGRNFYGGLRVYESDKGARNEARTLVHGTVDHGMQFTAPERRGEKITYYGPESGVALALASVRRSAVRVGVIGLGAGSLAAYARPGDVFRFYDINPLVEEFARREFTYLRDAKGKIELVMGDGRLSLERELHERYDLLVVDAFSGDAIPVHLITRQALELYFKRLKPEGVLALHITNTHLDLGPVVEGLGRALGKQAVLISNDSDPERKVYRSNWALLSSRPFRDQAIRDASHELPARPEVGVWTDDYNNLFRILK